VTIFRRWSPNEDVECRCARQKSRFSTNIWLSDRWLVKCEQQLRWPTVQFTEQTATHHWSCLSQPAWTTYEEKRTKVVRSGKSEAEVAKNRRLRSIYCTIEANYGQTRSIARPLCDSRATCSYSVVHNKGNGFDYYRAMLCKRGLCCHAASVRLSVRLSRSWITSKRIKISSIFFHHRVATPF